MKSLPVLLLSDIKKINNSLESVNFIDIEIYKGELKILEYNNREKILSFINIILGLDIYYEGKYYINGMDVSGLKKKATRLVIGDSIFFTSDRYGLIHELNVIDNILLQLRWIVILNETNKKKVISALKNMGLLHVTSRRIRELSPYELLQLLLLIAILKKNEIIIIDLILNDYIYNELKLNINHLLNFLKENNMSLLLIKKMDIDITENKLSIING
ncbi:hypothetical protein ACISK3_12775 [Morganella morganii]|nr:hypothetical protein [Morganella morganii]